MGRLFRFAPFVLGMLALLVTAISALAARETAFVVARSTNANVVEYEVDLASGQPVVPRWRMLEEDGRMEDLNGLERSSAYGVTLLERGQDFAEFEFKALPGYSVRVSAGEKGLRAEMRLHGETVILRRIFLEIGDGLFPAPRLIRVEGMAPKTGLPVSQELRPAGRGRWFPVQ